MVLRNADCFVIDVNTGSLLDLAATRKKNIRDARRVAKSITRRPSFAEVVCNVPTYLRTLRVVDLRAFGAGRHRLARSLLRSLLSSRSFVRYESTRTGGADTLGRTGWAGEAGEEGEANERVRGRRGQTTRGGRRGRVAERELG